MTEQTETTESTDLVLMDNITAADIFETDGGVEKYLKIAREFSQSIVPDVSTDKGRRAITSHAAKITRFKTTTDKMGKEAVAEKTAELKKYNNIRKLLWDGLDDIAKETKQPLTEWKEADKARVAKIESKLALLREMQKHVATDLSLIHI